MATEFPLYLDLASGNSRRLDNDDVLFAHFIDTSAAGSTVIQLGSANAASIETDLPLNRVTGGEMFIGSVNVTTLTLGASVTTGIINIGTLMEDTSTINIGTLANNSPTVNIATGASNASAVNIGAGTGVTVTVNGDMVITGEETVASTATFNGNTVIGTAAESDTLTINAQIAPVSGVGFRFNAASSIKSDAGDVTLQPFLSTVVRGGGGVALSGDFSTTNGNASVTSSVDHEAAGTLEEGDSIRLGDSTTLFEITALAGTAITLGVVFDGTGSGTLIGIIDSEIIRDALKPNGPKIQRVVIVETGRPGPIQFTHYSPQTDG